MSKVHSFWNYVCRYKYLLVMLFASLIIGVFDDNSVLKRNHRRERIAELRREIADYEARFDAASRILKSLDTEPGKLEQVAREKYYMKRADEDIFVIRPTKEDAAEDADTLDKDSIAQ